MSENYLCIRITSVNLHSTELKNNACFIEYQGVQISRVEMYTTPPPRKAIRI